MIALTPLRRLPLVTSRARLSSPAFPCPDDETARAVGHLLVHNAALREGAGLSANQVGLDVAVCVCMIGEEPLVLANPAVVSRHGVTPYVEGCLSFPGETLVTRRSVRVTVSHDLGEDITLGPPPGQALDPEDPELLRSVVVQHEIDHLNGVTFHSRRAGAPEPDSRRSIGRNERVAFVRGGETRMFKHKRRARLAEEGWTLAEEAADG